MLSLAGRDTAITLRMILFWSLQIFGVTVSPPTVGASGWFPWLWEEFPLFVLWVAFPPVPNSQAITWRMLEPALPASRCQIVTLPLAITQPRCVLRLRSPVSWLTLFSVPGFSAALVLFLSTSPVILQTKGYTLTSLPGLPTCSSCLPWISPHLWTTWNLDHLRSHSPPSLDALTATPGTDWVCFWVQTTLL